MNVSSELVLNLKKQLEADKERYFALFNQSVGGLLVLEHLSKHDELTQGEVEALVGGKIEAITPVDDGQRQDTAKSD